ncbi:MAG: hypothetical protein KGI25_07845 [Thaumarchaeota archaeon]|nr:hypothetical protein [Nitrososphaerota archaeon]
MLLRGARLVSEPCPYCKGVRIMKDGNAFCVSCGKEAKEEMISQITEKPKEEETRASTPIEILDQKLKDLTDELREEKDYAKQQQIIKSINDIATAKEKLKRL